jgi:hypothetical protein
MKSRMKKAAMVLAVLAAAQMGTAATAQRVAVGQNDQKTNIQRAVATLTPEERDAMLNRLSSQPLNTLKGPSDVNKVVQSDRVNAALGVGSPNAQAKINWKGALRAIGLLLVALTE